MGSFKKYPRLFLVLGLFLGLAISFHSFIMINIIEPITIMLWAFWRIISSVNQNIYWITLIICCSILVIRLFPAENNNTPDPAYSYKHRSQSRVEYWQSLLTNAVMDKDGIEYLRFNLKELLLRVIDQEEQSNSMSSEKVALLGKKPLPISVQDFLFPPKQKHKKFWDYQLHPFFLIPRWFRGGVIKFTQPHDTSIDETLEWMESNMEISHDK